MVQQLYAVNKRPALGKAIGLAGLAGGTLDALFAITSTLAAGHKPIAIFWSIASGLFRNEPPIKDMFSADGSTQFMYAVAGVLLHYFIAFFFITALFFVYPLLKKAFGSNLLIAIVYGIFTWLVMNYVVLPITFGSFPVYTAKTILGVLYLVVAIGLVGSLFAGRYYKRKKAYI